MPRDALFDAAVNKALAYALRLGLPLDDPERLRGGLELWYLKTRFAYRVPLDEVVAALSRATGAHSSWKGGAAGRWLPPDGER
jgi:hypothetical protein